MSKNLKDHSNERNDDNNKEDHDQRIRCACCIQHKKIWLTVTTIVLLIIVAGVIALEISDQYGNWTWADDQAVIESWITAIRHWFHTNLANGTPTPAGAGFISAITLGLVLPAGSAILIFSYRKYKKSERQVEKDIETGQKETSASIPDKPVEIKETAVENENHQEIEQEINSNVKKSSQSLTKTSLPILPPIRIAHSIDLIPKPTDPPSRPAPSKPTTVNTKIKPAKSITSSKPELSSSSSNSPPAPGGSEPDPNDPILFAHPPPPAPPPPPVRV